MIAAPDTKTALLPPESPAVNSLLRPSVDDSETSSLSLCTLVIWSLVLGVGIVGLALPYAHPKPPAKEAPPMQAELLQVELTTEPVLPPETQAPPPNPQQPPDLSPPVTAPEAPPMVAVAEPSPAIAFALPVEGPTRITDAKHASYATPTRPTTTTSTTAAPVQSITFGQGEGKQPAPDYPRQAMREGQEGVVMIQFKVGENGRVLSAEASHPTRWSLLNDAAVRVVRERWHFRPGPFRVYEVAIRFQLQ